MIGIELAFLLALQLTAPSQPTTVSVLRSAENAIKSVQSAAYVVTRDYEDSSGAKRKGHTSVLIDKSPFGFRADHHRDDGSNAATAVSDGKTTRTDSSGKLDQHATFASEVGGAMIVRVDPEFDVAATWHLLLDPEYFRKAIESGRTVYLWLDEIGDDPCHLILYARDHWTDYIWISTKSGLPRAMQRVNMMGGPAILSPRYEITDIRLNPEVSTDAFELQERSHVTLMPPDSSHGSPSPQESAVGGQPVNIIGQSLPDLELRDPKYKAVSLSAMRGRPTLITFWAPWCAPCLEELAAIERLQKGLEAQLRFVAIAVQDRRRKALEFIQAHAEYKFLFFTDPDMERETSPLASFFGLANIPVTVLTDREGKILDKWSGFDGEESLKSKLTKLTEQ